MSTEPNKRDPRIQRTLRIIRDSAISLIEEKGLERLTVRDITGHAKINRATFYLHYQDKYDLLEKMADEMLEEMVGAMQLPPAMEPHELSMDADTPPPSFIRQFEHAAANAPFYKVMLGPNGLPGFAARLENVIQDALYQRSALAQPNDRLLKVPRELIIRYTTSAHIGLLMYWLENDMPYTPKYMAAQLKKLHMLGPTRVSVGE